MEAKKVAKIYLAANSKTLHGKCLLFTLTCIMQIANMQKLLPTKKMYVIEPVWCLVFKLKLWTT